MTRRNIAVILAGGVGHRTGLSTPKQFFKLAGKSVIEHTIAAFEFNRNIDEIAIVVHVNSLPIVEQMVLANGFTKVKKLLQGGAERYCSSLSAIMAYEGQEVNLIFHDAVRPLVSERIIDDVCRALEDHAAVDVAIPTADTIIEVDADSNIVAIPERSALRRGQTPQAFHIETIREAYRIALQDSGFRTTDDCGVVRRYLPQVPVFVVPGEESNMKLTYREDIYLMDKYFQMRNIKISGTPDYSLFKGKVAVVFGASSGIGKDIAAKLEEAGAGVYRYSRSQGGVDVGNAADVKRAFDEVSAAEPVTDYVICTAGILNREPLHGMEDSVIEAAVRTNYIGTVNVAKAAYPLLKKSHGQLVFFTSSSYTRGRSFYSIYSSTKAAIVNFVQAIAEEWQQDGIRVNCIDPERTRTPMRVKNFGIEPEGSLLESGVVAEETLKCLLSDYTGQVVDVRRPAK